MANRATLQRCTFSNYPGEHKSFGYRLYDDYSQGYDNTQDETIFKLEPLEFLRHVVSYDHSDSAEGIFNSISENQKGIYIDDNWFDWNEIQDIIGIVV
jgi:hypothetical protein